MRRNQDYSLNIELVPSLERRTSLIRVDLKIVFLNSVRLELLVVVTDRLS